ncbi:MAG TPA: cytochrome c biogenesis heme-transporting ATPase CcmA [Pyrinomonadaceae bacterium]
MLEVANLECVRGDRRLFRDVSFSLAAGTLLQLTGPNGSGKTSLLRIIAGLVSPESGEVLWRGAQVGSLAEEYSRSVTYLGHRTAVKEELSSTENLRISNGLSGIEVTGATAQQALARVGLAGRENLPARFLSEGQRRRSALARLITCSTTLWLLDEVLASLDRAAGSLIESIIGEHLNRGGIAIVATHQELHIPTSSFQRLELSAGINSEAASPS